jgi:phosphoserine aminotransferase
VRVRRVFNFSAGPGVLPEECLAQARDEMLDWQGLGYSVIESSHRHERFVALMHETVSLVRELMAVPASHQVLLLQGGAHLQFAMVPLNLLGGMRASLYNAMPIEGVRALVSYLREFAQRKG